MLEEFFLAVGSRIGRIRDRHAEEAAKGRPALLRRMDARASGGLATCSLQHMLTLVKQKTLADIERHGGQMPLEPAL